MTYDRRWPHMHPLDGRGIPGLSELDRVRAERIGRAIASRTQTKAFFNVNTGGIFFARGDVPQMGPYELPFVDSKLPEPHEIDGIVQYMNLSLVPSETKERWSEGHERRAAHDREEDKRRMFDERAHDTESYATFLDRKRRGTQSTVVVL